MPWGRGIILPTTMLDDFDPKLSQSLFKYHKPPICIKVTNMNYNDLLWNYCWDPLIY